MSEFIVLLRFLPLSHVHNYVNMENVFNICSCTNTCYIVDQTNKNRKEEHCTETALSADTSISNNLKLTVNSILMSVWYR